MKIVKNKFGHDYIYEEKDLKGLSFIRCHACTSLYTEFQTWANKNKNIVTTDIIKANNIIIISCQVTDLAIYDELEIIKKYYTVYKDSKKYFIAGCLAKRFDIKLPKYVNRLETLKSDLTEIKDFNLAKYGKPFWIKDFKEIDNEYKDGHLFRTAYPIKISSGCKNKCEYCSIPIVRGKYYEADFEKQKFIMLKHKTILLNSDNPSSLLLKKYINYSIKNNIELMIRNIEPNTILEIKEELINLSNKKLLKVLHVPIQSINKKVLIKMKRNYSITIKCIKFLKYLKNKYKIYLATNIIIDYYGFKNPKSKNIYKYKNWENKNSLCNQKYKIFDYISWNPYWNGNYNHNKAKIRYNKYIGE